MAQRDTPSGADVVVLDVDGTLVDSTYHHAIAWHRALLRLGHPVPMWRIHGGIGLGGDRLVAHLVGDGFEEQHGDEARDLWHTEYDGLVHSVAALPGAAELLRELESRGVARVFATSGDPEYTRHALHVLQATDLVDDVVTSNDVPSSKPAPDIIDAALDSVQGRTAVVVGDSLWDVAAARRAGLPMVAVRTGGIGAQAFLEEGAARVYDEPRDLLEALDEVLGLATPR